MNARMTSTRYSKRLGLHTGRGILLTIAVSLLWAGTGCKDNYPKPTAKHITPADVTGCWQYSETYPSCMATITFASNGTFDQIVSPSKAQFVYHHAGRWTLLPGGDVEMDGVIVFEAGRWIITPLMWGFVDDPKRNGAVDLFGGIIPDPDSYDRFVRVLGSPLSTKPSDVAM